MSLIKIGNRIFDETLYSLAHGFGGLDEVSKEAFVNHNHFEGINRHIEAEQQIKT